MQPNIVLILADDMGYGDLSCLNSESKIDTPRMDAMAREGMTFTDAHGSSAVCTPSRYSILTGRYAWRGRLQRSVLGPVRPPLIESEMATLPGFLHEAGYHCGCVGKWHLGMDWPFRSPHDLAGCKWNDQATYDALADIDWSGRIGGGPIDRGFDSYFGVDVPNFPPYCWLENDRVTEAPTTMKPEEMFGLPGPMVEGWSLEAILPELAKRAVAYIEERAAAGQPFFLYLPLTAPHTPIAPTQAFRGRSRAGIYGDFVAQVDDVVGQVLDAVRHAGIDDRTMVIATSDNGSPGRNGSAEAPGTVVEKFGHRSSWILRGMKADAWDGGHRIPCIARWPGNIPRASTCGELVCLMDFFATVAAMLDRPLPATASDSLNLLPYFLGESVAQPLRESLVHHSVTGMFGIRRGPWKLIEGTASGGFSPSPPVTAFDPPAQLYHMDDDISERRNRYFEEPDVVHDLRHLLADCRRPPI